MDINEIKKLIKNSSSVLVLEQGEPSFVILDYAAYKEMASGRTDEKEVKINQTIARRSGFNSDAHERESEVLDRLNKEILALRNQIEAEEKGLSSSGVD